MADIKTWTDGEVLYASDLNNAFETVVPIGGIIAWHKNFNNKESGTNTSVTTLKLIDTAATFQTNNVAVDDGVFAYYYDASETSSTGQTYTVDKTITLSDDDSKGVRVGIVTNEIYSDSGDMWCKMRFHYTDGTNADSNENTTNISSWQSDQLYKNPYESKTVWKIEVMVKGTNVADHKTRYNKVWFNSAAKVVSVDAETQLTIDTDMFLTTGINYDIYSTPPLKDNFRECNGQTVDDSDSPYDGLDVPNLNQTASYFLKGDMSSGAASKFGTTSDNYDCYTVIWVMRIK